MALTGWLVGWWLVVGSVGGEAYAAVELRWCWLYCSDGRWIVLLDVGLMLGCLFI